VVVATDGSVQARAAAATAATFPWPRGAGLLALVASELPPAEWPRATWAAVGAGLERVAAQARRALERGPHTVRSEVVHRAPTEAVLAAARGAGAVVVGSRGHGALGRLLLGSVSRTVVRAAGCPVLVVRGPARRVRRLLLGVDGSAGSRRAVAFVARLAPPRGGRVTVVRVVEPARLASAGLLPAGIRARLAGEAAALRRQAVRAAERDVRAAGQRLRRAGWRVRTALRAGEPLPALLAAAAAERADAVAVGVRGVGGVERLLLGSVAEGLLGRCPVPVLVVR
jgi:nucleotide-binding universal stress UspA family protein